MSGSCRCEKVATQLCNPGTFSSSRNADLLLAARRAISKNKVPRASSANPLRFPAIEKDWQGKPPQIRSISGSAVGSMVLASAKNTSPSVSYIVLYAWFAYLSISQWPTHSKPPTASRPERNPPIPANISKNRIAMRHPTYPKIATPPTFSCRNLHPRPCPAPVPLPVLPPLACGRSPRWG